MRPTTIAATTKRNPATAAEDELADRLGVDLGPDGTAVPNGVFWPLPLIALAIPARTTPTSVPITPNRIATRPKPAPRIRPLAKSSEGLAWPMVDPASAGKPTTRSGSTRPGQVGPALTLPK